MRDRFEYRIEVHGGKQGLYFEEHGEAAGFVEHNEPKVKDVIVRLYASEPKIITYKGKRYYVRGGIRGPLFITLGLEIKPKGSEKPE